MSTNPWTVVYVSQNNSKATFVKSTEGEALDKIADLMLVPHKVTINRVGERAYLVTSIRNTLHDGL